MPRVCTICTHEQRREIDAVLWNETPYRIIAKRFDASPAAVNRHREHLPSKLVKAQQQEDVSQAIDVVKQLKAINGATLAILKEARDEGNGEVALKAYIVGAIIGRAGASEVGLYFGFSRLEDGRNGVALGAALDDEQASRLMNFLHDLTEGALPNWDEHAFTQEYLNHPAGMVADNGEA